MSEAIKPGKYRHYKGNEYQVISMATHSETLEPMVGEQALYGENRVGVRAARLWNELVQVNGQTVLRFAPVEE